LAGRFAFQRTIRAALGVLYVGLRFAHWLRGSERRRAHFALRRLSVFLL
jgi:hypothetical protein